MKAKAQKIEHNPAKVKVRGLKAIINKELPPFSRQIAAMLNAGMSIVASIATVEEQLANPSFRNVVFCVREKIESGGTFSEGLSLFPRVFDDLYVNIVRAGERSGQFASTMRRLSQLLEDAAKLRRKVKSAMSYPTVVFCLAIAIAISMIIFVVPTFAGMFEDFGGKLPGLTQMLLDLSNFMRKRWWIILLAITAIVFDFKRWKRTPKGAMTLDRYLLRAPVFGPLIQRVSIARFARVMTQMVHSGVPILDSLRIVAKVSGNHVISHSITQARGVVEQGEALSKGLEEREGIPLLVVRMIAAGERSGKLDEMLENVAETYEDEVETMLASLTSLIEPLLMVFLGVVIGGIVVAMFLPIFKMSTLVGN